MDDPKLLDHFSALDDPRQPGKVLHPLPEAMPLVLCATLAGADAALGPRRARLPGHASAN